MVDHNNCVRLSEYCFDACEALKNATRGKIGDDLDESEWAAMEDLRKYVDQFRSFCSCANNSDRNMSEIERTLRRGRGSPHVEYNKEKVERHILKIWQTISSIDSTTLLPREDPGEVEHVPQTASVDTHGGAVASEPESGMSPPRAPSQPLFGILIDRSFPDRGRPTPCGRLIRSGFTMDELSSLIETILSNKDETKIINSLPLGDAQKLIDVMDEVRFTFTHHR